MSAEQNKALVRRFFEAQEDVNRGKADLDALAKLLATDFISHTKLLPGQQPGREGYKRAIAELLATGSNTRYLIEDQVAEGDKVVTRLIVHAIHDRRELMGVAPSGREVAYKGIAIHRIERGKIAEEWALGTTGPKLMRQRLKQELEQERIERERIEQELLVAQRIQQASLPKEVPELEGWQISPLYQPAREVGGDFYDFHLLSEGRLGVVVGDASGKGVPAALVMATTCGMLQLAAQAVGSSSPREVLAQVNETLFARIPANMFVTCFYAILAPKSATLSYANAGHDLPYLHRTSSEAEELRARGMPLGLMPGMGYEEKETTLQAGEAALFYSDGIVEAHNPKGEMFGFPRLRALVAEHGRARSLEEALLEELYSFVGEGWEQEDDITLLTLRRSAARGSVSGNFGATRKWVSEKKDSLSAI
ncbi:MAG: SpoIIE family protein phosphatase [Actinomycetota bacterium]|nr:SpoIIE family protein phosphatase [Actinomycetota bacterium]